MTDETRELLAQRPSSDLDVRIRAVASALLQQGVLDPDRKAHAELRDELLTDDLLYRGVRDVLANVGYDLVQFFGHIGVRVARGIELGPALDLRNNLALDARHVRMIVYLWSQLVYRQIKEVLREEDTEPRGRGQTLFDLAGVDAEDEPPELPYAEVVAEFEEEYSRSQIDGVLTGLRKSGFIKQERKKGAVRPGPALYVLVDRVRMEEFVVGLARKRAADEEPAT